MKPTEPELQIFDPRTWPGYLSESAKQTATMSVHFGKGLEGRFEEDTYRFEKQQGDERLRLTERHPDVVLRDIARKEDLLVALAAEEQALRTWQQVETEFQKELVVATSRSELLDPRMANKRWRLMILEGQSFEDEKTIEALTKVLIEALTKVLESTFEAAEGMDGLERLQLKGRPCAETPAKPEYEEAYVYLRLLQRAGVSQPCFRQSQLKVTFVGVNKEVVISVPSGR